MTPGEISIESLTQPSEEHHVALEALLPQLSSAEPPNLEDLEAIARQPATTVLIARLDGRIVGTLTLALFTLLTGVRAWIEDVVVDASTRGRGVASELIGHALVIAQRRGARTVDLTSRPSRAEANALYQRLGFERRETNVYRIDLYTPEGSKRSLPGSGK